MLNDFLQKLSIFDLIVKYLIIFLLTKLLITFSMVFGKVVKKK